MLVMLFAFIAAFIVGIPVAFGLGIAGVIGLEFFTNATSSVSAVRMYTSLDSFALLAIPLFAIMGHLMEKGGTLQRLVGFLKILLGPIKGGMAYVNVLNSMVFASVSGTAVSDVSSMGYLEMKMMRETGLPKAFSGALTAASAVAGPTIPPSVAMVVFAQAVGSGISISGLFMSGIIPGILLGLVLIILSFFYVHRKDVAPYVTVMPRASLSEIAKAFWRALPILLLPLIVIGGILFGVFTVTEAASVGIMYSLFVGFFVTKELKVKDLPAVLVSAALTTGTVALIFGTSSLLSWLLTINQIPQMIADALIAFTTNQQVYMLIVVGVLLLVGCALEPNAAIIMLAPILFPIAMTLGIHPFQFGLVFVMAIEIGLLTPPVGVLLFVTSSVGDIELSDLIRSVWPFVLGEIFVVLLAVFIPQIPLLIPTMLGLV